MVKEAQPVFNIGRKRTLRIGFVPLNDSAPIIVAQEKGLFFKRELNVSLQRELGWATLRDKIIYRELHAAHALAAMPLAATLGLGSIRADCLSAIVLNLNGNAITLSEQLWECGVHDGAGLKAEIDRLRHAGNEQMLTFGIVNRFSSHHHILRRWLGASGISEAQVRMVVLPPSQMAANLASGNLDGFCVGEPWNSVAVESGAGWVIATSGEIEPNHPEKVLMVRSDFAEKCENEHLALISALHEACVFCDDPANRGELAELLGRPEYLATNRKVIEAGLNGTFHFGHQKTELMPEFCIFNRDGANEPTLARAAWTLDLVRRSGACAEPSALNQHLAGKVFPAEIYRRAVETVPAPRNNLYEPEKQLTVG